MSVTRDYPDDAYFTSGVILWSMLGIHQARLLLGAVSFRTSELLEVILAFGFFKS